ncbi:uncharacterized protein LOC112568216 isoform X2 [Pomacea canaliculata]|uniref:uncharacterized protein LOC112568216 isoform X2 n=1 Tax=Pomacea canaliculata TaxID=400727 RepID=UPI000D73C4B7|nr:uncharacterized protein LOC112568216 isoform X2 [Pomacea canaliculata]
MDQKLFVLCSVFFIAGVVHSDPVINECPYKGKYVYEDSTDTFSCSNYGTKMSWLLYNGTNRMTIGICDQQSCISADKNRFNLEATKIQNWNYKSQLEIKNVTREHARFLICFDSSAEQDYCELHVIAPARVPSNNCSVSISNWQVNGTCLVFRMYTSDNNYWCAWYENNNNNKSFGYMGFGSTLKNYTYNSRNYTRGKCSFTKEMSLVEGHYTYSLRVFPGSGVYYNNTITIAYPDEPTHDCPQHVFEGSDFHCTCKSNTTGSPPAKVAWDELVTEVLQVNNASRHLNGELHTCRLVWGPQGYINRKTSFIIGVAYGPSAVLLNSTQKDAENGSYIISVTCTAVDVYPSAVFTWNITCLRQTTHTNIQHCIVKLTEHEELSVTCTASNAYYKHVFLSQTILLPISDEASATAAGTGSLNGGLIGGVTAAAVVVLVIIAVVVVYIIKRRKGMAKQEGCTSGSSSDFGNFLKHNNPLSKLYAVVKKPKPQTPIERHSAPSGDLYTIPTSGTIQQGENGYNSVYETADSTAFYEENNFDHQAEEVAKETSEWTAKAQSTVTPAVAVKKFQDLSGGYMNVTEVLTDSGLGVYHVVPWASNSGTMNPESSTQAISEDEYNALHFEKDRTGQEDLDVDYNHLQTTEDNYFTLEPTY